MFKGQSTPGMKQLVLDIIKDKARRIIANGNEYRMIGTLLIEPVSASLDIVNITIDLGSTLPPIRPTPVPGKR